MDCVLKIFQDGKTLHLTATIDMLHDHSMQKKQMLSTLAVDEFKVIYREEFGEEISDDEAQAMGIGLLKLLDTLLSSD